VIVADASAVVDGLLRPGRARSVLEEAQIEAPALIDAEVAHTLRGHVLAGRLSAAEGWRLLEAYRWMAVTRHYVFSMFDRIWELRDNLTAYDASYVALAEAIDCPLVTGDARLSRAPGLRCAITVLPG
jgi:predicted nucleic acid-binding protein